MAASPGAAVGKAVFDANTAEKLGHEGQKVVLIRDETNPDDVHGMLAAQGILTARGGKTSHAAVVARGFGIPCVAGCEGIKVNTTDKFFTVGSLTVKEGDMVSIDGSTGAVYPVELPLIAPEVSGFRRATPADCPIPFYAPLYGFLREFIPGPLPKRLPHPHAPH